MHSKVVLLFFVCAGVVEIVYLAGAFMCGGGGGLLGYLFYGWSWSLSVEKEKEQNGNLLAEKIFRLLFGRWKVFLLL